MTLSSFGADKVEYASKAGDALAKMGKYEFDVVLCDYDLGNGYDGLYLFEEVKERNLIKQSCVFMIVTGERRSQRVISAAELAPDDYLLKPFTGEVLRERLEKAMRRREAFRLVDEAIMRHEYLSAIEVCSRLIGERGEFTLDFMKLKGSLALKIGDFDSARSLYMDVLRLAGALGQDGPGQIADRPESLRRSAAAVRRSTHRQRPGDGSLRLAGQALPQQPQSGRGPGHAQASHRHLPGGVPPPAATGGSGLAQQSAGSGGRSLPDHAGHRQIHLAPQPHPLRRAGARATGARRHRQCRPHPVQSAPRLPLQRRRRMDGRRGGQPTAGQKGNRDKARQLFADAEAKFRQLAPSSAATRKWNSPAPATPKATRNPATT